MLRFLRLRATSDQSVLLALLAAAFTLRLGVGIAFFLVGVPALGIERKSWWESGYSLYGVLAINLAEGRGLRLGSPETGFVWATRPPLYPLLLASEYLVFGRSSLALIAVQAAIGSGTVLLTYFIAKVLFERRAALLAATMATGYPYYVAHDTAHQETVLLTFLTAGAVCFLLRARVSGSLREHALAGWWLGLGILCKESLLMFVVLIVPWLLWSCPRTRGRGGMTRIGAFLLAVLSVVSPWLARNTAIYGRPLLTTAVGLELWIGNNEFTLSHYPWESIDKSTAQALEALTPVERAELGQLGELERSRWFRRRALEFIRVNPATAVEYAAVKVLAGFSPVISPAAGSWLRVALYAASYLPVLVLALIGGALARRRWRDLSLIYLLFLSFVGVSMVAVAHTSHRSHLDVYLMIFASHALAWRLWSASPMRPSRVDAGAGPRS